MKPESSSPTRASRRIKANAKVNTAAADEGNTTDNAAPADVPTPTAVDSDRAAPQAPPATTVTHGFQAPPAAAAAAVGQPTVGLPPKLSQQQSRQNSHTAAAPKVGPPPPYPGPPPAYPGNPPHAGTTTAPLPPPPMAPPIQVDPKILEERKRNALAYAMQDYVVGGIKGRNNRRVGNPNAGGKGAVTKPGESNSSAAGKNSGSVAKTTTHGFSATASSISASATILGANSISSMPPPAVPYPPASKLISGVHALAEAAASSAKAVDIAPVKRKVGRPRKNANGNAAGATAPTAGTKAGTKRKVGRPRKIVVANPNTTCANPNTTTARPATSNAVSSETTNAAHDLNFLAHHLQKEAITKDTATASCKTSQEVKEVKTVHTTNRVEPVVSQSVPSSNASSDDEATGHNDGSESKSQQSTPSPQNYNPLPFRRDASSVYDDEYARFMRSLMGGEDQSITTFKTWKSIKSKGEASMVVGGSVMGSNFETLDEDDVSYQLTSDEDDEDDDDDDENELQEDANGHASPQKRSASMAQLPPTPMCLPHEGTNDEDLLNVFTEIEGLMEEDLEAAVMASLIGGPSIGEGELSGSSWQKPGTFGVNKSAPNKASMGAIMGTSQQKAITTPGQSTKKKKSTTTVVTTPSPCVGKDRHGAAAALEVPAVSKDQLSRLRGIMARHHQLLLQQATLSVRAAYVQKVRKDGMNSSTNSLSPQQQHNTPPMPPRGRGKKTDSSLPESRLDTRSLTFCSRPVDAGCSYVNDFFGGETPEELSECLDGAVGMLQDLEQNWKDAVRNSIQLSFQPPMGSQAHQSQAQGGRRNLNFGETAQPPSNNTGTAESNNGNNTSTVSNCSRPLTRSAFTKTLLERELEMSSSSSNSSGKSSSHDGASSPKKAQHPQSSDRQHNAGRISVFDVRGLARLKETFSALDNSVKDIQMGREKGKNKDGINILAPDLHGKACETLLKHARAEICFEYLPGRPDLGKCLTHAPEAFDEPDKVNRPLTKRQEADLRKNRHTFSSGEDNLILRGVNLYGEKEWCLVSDRFLPDRVVNSISQRYNKLCFLIYKANGIAIDEKGKLGAIPTFSKGATYDISKVNKIKPARAPTTMNVHRWTLEEDIAILKAVPVMGNLWAEINTKLMPHRDRGHIRKRYQVLQRRIPKGITKMNMKYLKRAPEQRVVKPPKAPKRARTSTVSRGSPAKKKATSKKKASSIKAPSKLPATAAAPAVKLLATAAAGKTATTAAAPTSPAAKATASVAPASPGIFQRLVNASKRLPMSPIKSPIKSALRSRSLQSPVRSVPIKSSPIKYAPSPQLSPKIVPIFCSLRSPRKQVTRPFSKNHGSQALEAVIKSEVEKNKAERQSIFLPSPETRGVAAVLGGFSTSSRLDFGPSREQEEYSHMGVEKILGNNDDWSQASGMQRLIEAGTAESNFMHGYHHHREAGVPPQSPNRSSELPMYQVHDGEASGLSVINGGHHHAGEMQGHSHYGGEQRKSILSSVMEKTRENSLKRKSATAFPSTPTKASHNQENVLPAPDGYPSSIPTSSMTFNMTPVEEEAIGGLGGVSSKGELSMNHEFFEYFMSSDKSRQATTPGRVGTMTSSPAKPSMKMSPIKIGNSTPLSQFGTLLGGGISGPLDGCNSLFMGASDFDAVAALKDLSNSAPNTPSKLLRPRDSFQSSREAVPYNQDHDDAEEEEEQQDSSRRKKPKTSFFGQVKAKVDGRKTG